MLGSYQRAGRMNLNGRALCLVSPIGDSGETNNSLARPTRNSGKDLQTSRIIGRVLQNNRTG
jgi:hypothetical protein